MLGCRKVKYFVTRNIPTTTQTLLEERGTKPGAVLLFYAGDNLGAALKLATAFNVFPFADRLVIHNTPCKSGLVECSK